MLNYEFWSLLCLTLVFHGLMAAVAVLIYLKQQAFQRSALGKIDSAVVGIQKDLHDPLVMQALCKTMLDDLEARIANKMRLSLQGMLGNAQQQIQKVGGQGAANKFMAALHVLGAKNKLKAAKEMAPLLFGGNEHENENNLNGVEPGNSGIGGRTELDGPRREPESASKSVHGQLQDSKKKQELNEYMIAQLTPAQIEAGTQKAKELGLA